ncbi:uncharacterized protein PHACADRAFT_202360 [Phanerochaete carnosa HHB-10118-sp]|uniref:STI1 domain-containing protein n=1 Tax=Phanerochaete carnosa (strain HHB-10118-sp) TaxID=650164 RepID=K5VCM6_PHACS|nr:uncharacterized protein PHACADRAFT_202360 [Phanerochaete carnosa HHB-10118-sp]EKM48813.1 hypothetical protein PHACADRAFT_202360 [Phanerochaete carnosa HHB-10118-sp]
MAGFSLFPQMGLNLNNPNMMQGMLQNPEFLNQMSTIMSDPAVLEQVIAANPQLAAMAPPMCEMFQSEGFRQLMSNPELLRIMRQMSSSMGGGGAGGFPMTSVPGGGSNTGASTQGGAGGAPTVHRHVRSSRNAADAGAAWTLSAVVHRPHP